MEEYKKAIRKKSEKIEEIYAENHAENIECIALTENDHEYLLDKRRLSAIIAINSLLVGFPLLF